MREIKFRAWDKEEKRFWTLGDAGENSANGSVQFYANKGCLVLGRLTASDIGVGVTTDFEKFPLMQYTGLKDKNGREIYEYDIVRGEDTDSVGTEKYMGVVMYFAPSFEIIGIKQHDGLSRVLERQCEVIGNVYENKNLLEEK